MDRPPLNDAEFSAAVAAVTSAFGDPTRRDIFLFVRDAAEAGVTAAEVAERFELHANVARHHLDKLAAGGYLDVHVDRLESAGAGRPSKRYRATEKALEFPARRDDLLVTLLGRALALLPEREAAAMAEEVGEEYGRALAHQMSPGDGHHRSFQASLHAVAEALTAHGFAAHAEARGSSLAIVAEQCPFGDTATQHPVICAVDRGIVRGMLAGLYGDTAPATTASRAQGDDACVTAV
ncbi:MAG: helix-turn-helix transcriptional regulator [Actinomycetota bacterium]